MNPIFEHNLIDGDANTYKIKIVAKRFWHFHEEFFFSLRVSIWRFIANVKGNVTSSLTAVNGALILDGEEETEYFYN